MLVILENFKKLKILLEDFFYFRKITYNTQYYRYTPRQL